MSDLSTVQEKITLCQSMLVNIQFTSQIDTDESLLAIIGFLEACVPRVRELINTGMTLLKEETLTKCFLVNDELCKILEYVEHPEKLTAMPKDASGDSGNSSGDAKPSSDVASAIAAAQNDGADILDSLDFDAFGFEDQKQAVKTDQSDGKPATSSAASAALEDLLAPPSSLPPPPAASAKTEGGTTKKQEGTDEFDDFFNKRDGNNSFSIDE